jgi:hypothetical protein
MVELVWRSVNIFHHDPDRTGLVVDAVRPLIRTLVPEVSTVYFVPHWRRGPHIRIPIRATERAFDDVVAPAVRDVIGRYLGEHPSTTVLDERAAMAEHARLAVEERERGRLTPWAADNSVEFDAHDRREHVLGEAASDLLAGYYADTNDIVFDMLDWTRCGGSRMALAVDLFIAAAHRFLPPVSYGYMSFRGHADAFLAKQPDAVRDRFENVYLANADRVRRRVVEITAEDQVTVPFGGLLDVLRQYRNRARDLITAGELVLNVDDDGRAEAWGSQWGAWSDRSAFHRTLGGHRAAAETLGEWTVFQQYRIVLNWLYLNLYRLGIGEVDRNLVCHIVSRAVEDVHGVSALDRIRDLISYVDGGGRL